MSVLVCVLLWCLFGECSSNFQWLSALCNCSWHRYSYLLALTSAGHFWWCLKHWIERYQRNKAVLEYIILGHCGNNCPQNAIMHRSIMSLVTQPNSHLMCPAFIPFTAGNGMLLFHLSLLLPFLIIIYYLILIFFLVFICLAWTHSLLLSYRSRLLHHLHLISSWWTLWGPASSSPDMNPPACSLSRLNPSMCAPFWLEIAECTIAPVAMEDSDHEAHSSSDEQDSCPDSPNQSRDHDAEQVPLTLPKTPKLFI